jgi:hypothetical protein
MKIECSERDLIKLTNSFVLHLQNEISLVFRKELLKNIKSGRRGGSFLNSLADECGIYYFSQSNTVKYIGSSSPSVGLRSRLFTQINATGDPEWNQLMNDGRTYVGVILFNRKNWTQILDLEHYIIAGLKRPTQMKNSELKNAD